jgi:parallel beta-helix repeat protein
MANRHSSSPTVQGCTFTGNSVNDRGGGMASMDSSGPCVIRCTFTDNSSMHNGGAVENEDTSQPVFTRCTFSGNSASSGGGGMWSQDKSDVTLANCLFSANRAEYDGGAMTTQQATAGVMNCTISGNKAGRQCGGLMCSAGGVLHVENSILWANADKSNEPGSEPAQLAAQGSRLAADYCCAQGLTGALGGVGNVGTNPLFVDPNEGDYHLCSQGWRWAVEQGAWTYDSETSPCIDAGNPGRPLGQEPMKVPQDPNNLRGVNTRIDMGAYGGTVEASMAPAQWRLLADLNNDDRVDWLDLAHLAADWATTGEDRPGDLSRDGAVNGADLVPLGAQWRHKAGVADPQAGN